MLEGPKRTPRLSDEWLNDIWNVRGLDYGERELENFDKLISSAVARCLKEDADTRAEIAVMLSHLSSEDISVAMLDAYASEARREHKIPASRFLALIAITRRFDILDAVLREIGGKALDRSDARIFRIGKYYVENINATRDLQAVVQDIYNNPTA